VNRTIKGKYGGLLRSEFNIAIKTIADYAISMGAGGLLGSKVKC
jgi:hypothetical protein